MVGDQLRKGFEMILKLNGSTVTVYRDYALPSQTVHTFRAMKNRKDKTRDVFQFPERIDVKPGDIIICLNSDDLWEVDETEDRLAGDTFVHFDAFVTRYAPRTFNQSK